MTKRKAIEAALSRWEGSGFWRVEEDAVILAERSYEAGRIAGLREAASAANEPSDAKKYRQWANTLAKKARAK